jgi:hypothetical protein
MSSKINAIPPDHRVTVFMERAETRAVGREINGKAGVELVAVGRDMEQE